MNQPGLVFLLKMAKTPTKFILATKLGMSQIYNEKGILVPVTLLQTAPNVVTQVKTAEKDGYSAVQIAAGKKKQLSKALKGHFKGLGEFRWVREFKATSVEGKDLTVGDTIGVQVFAPGEEIKVVGVTKGKGFQGGVKRHGFHGAPGSHGHHHVMRHVGSIGQRFPQQFPAFGPNLRGFGNLEGLGSYANVVVPQYYTVSGGSCQIRVNVVSPLTLDDSRRNIMT